MKALAAAAAAMGLAAVPAHAAGPEAAKALALSVCAACHGANGVSVADHIPNLAGQRAAYLVQQLEAFRSGSRKSELMQVIAGQLAADDIPDLARHFAALPGAQGQARSALLASVAGSQVTLPTSFDKGFRRYLVKSDAESKTVSHYYASDIAWAAAAAGRPLPDGSGIYIVTHAAQLDARQQPLAGADGQFLPGPVRSYAAMARERDWGRTIPEMLRNENWNYAVFDGERAPRTTINQAECLACHKPQAATSYLFLHADLAAAARKPAATP